MPPFASILSFSFLGNDVRTYLIALGGVIALYVIYQLIFHILLRRIHHIAKKAAADIDKSVLKVLHDNEWLIFLSITVVYLNVILVLPPSLNYVADHLLNVFLIVIAIRASNHWIDFGVQKYVEKKRQSAEKFTIELLGKIAKILVWVFGVLFLISSFGYDITSLIAGLGIGGIALALAIQNILADLISSISIYLDKPFQVGDLIIFGDKMGTVTNIGLKTTRLTSIHGEEIVVSNKKLTESEIHNYGRMKNRRVEVILTVTYNTSLKKIKKIPLGLEKIVRSVKDTSFEHAHFKSFDRFGKNFVMVFYVNSKDHQTYLDRLQEVNYKIEEFFEKQKIKFSTAG